MAFLRAFELTASHLSIAPTLPLFSHAFRLQRSCPKGEKAKGKLPKGIEEEPGKCGWVSFKQRKTLFKLFADSVHNFKDKFYVVRPITSKGWQNIV
ncbi:hypothetical protein A2U01_0059278, partial [Trifolium medium]|nr:hypothetical protein [Trifolium medium]